MLRALLSGRFPYSRATKILTSVGGVLGILLCMLSIIFALQGQMNFSPMFAGLYLLYAAAIEQKQSAARYISSLIARRQRIEKNEILPVEIVAACGKATALSLIGRLNPGKYHQIWVLAEDGLEKLGALDEQALCTAVLQNPEEMLDTLLKRMKNGQDLP